MKNVGEPHTTVRSEARKRLKNGISEPTLIPGVISDTLTTFMVVILLEAQSGDRFREARVVLSMCRGAFCGVERLRERRAGCQSRRQASAGAPGSPAAHAADMPPVESDPRAEPRRSTQRAGRRQPSMPRNCRSRPLSTLRQIQAGGPFPFEKDGIVFGNRERLLPPHPRGFYHEYTVPTPRARDRGARRIVCGGPSQADRQLLL